MKQNVKVSYYYINISSYTTGRTQQEEWIFNIALMRNTYQDLR
jgi:hypothetical protein